MVRPPVDGSAAAAVGFPYQGALKAMGSRDDWRELRCLRRPLRVGPVLCLARGCIPGQRCGGAEAGGGVVLAQGYRATGGDILDTGHQTRRPAPIAGSIVRRHLMDGS